ncbi:MAG: hypothetical protein WEC15_01590 [Flavobacteriales bacterium]
MSILLKRLRALFIAGLFILLPFTVLVLVLGKGYAMIHPLMEKVAIALGLESLMGVRVLVVGGMLVLCLVAGALMGFTRGAGSRWLEQNLLHFIPGYAYIRMRLDDVLAAESGKQHEAILARIDDAWSPGMLVERGEDGRCVVFIPDVPEGSSGSVCIVEPDLVRVLDVPFHVLNNSIRNYGKGLLALEAYKKA